MRLSEKIFWGFCSLICGAILLVVFLMLHGMWSNGDFASRLPPTHPLSDANILGTPKSTATISTEELLEFSRSYVDKEKMEFKTLIIGSYNGHAIKVTYPCSDICPNYTKRVIELDVQPSECVSSGGEIKTIYVPFSIASMKKEFCFPKVLVENKIYDFIN